MNACKFCQIASGELVADLVLEDEHALAFLDYRPWRLGHCLVIPRAHYETLLDVPPQALIPLWTAVQLMARAMEEGLGAEGSFVAINNRVSQSVPHLHVHVVPRRRKDGMKGFFWPRESYRDSEEQQRYCRLLREAIQRLRAQGSSTASTPAKTPATPP
ncbi:MAG: HIT family protein [Bryobacteraceae bacterium]